MTDKCPDCGLPIMECLNHQLLNAEGAAQSAYAIVDVLREQKEHLKAHNAKLLATARKVSQCFPEHIAEDETRFNIPAYVIDELREAVKEASAK